MTAPRPLPPQHTRHPTRLVALCQRMRKTGMSVPEIRAHVAKHYKGPTPALSTIRLWVDPDYVESHRQSRAQSARRRRERGGRPLLRTGHLEGADLDRVMLALRARGLTYSTIATVLDLYHGVVMSSEQVRYRMRGLGVQPSASKSAAARRAWMAKHAKEERVDAAA